MSTKLGYFLFEHLVTLAWVPPNDALFWSLDVNLPSYEPPIDYKICYPGLFVVLIFFLFKQFYKTNTVDFRRIQTGVVRVEGEQTDLLDATTTALRHGKGGFKQTEDSGSFLLTTFLRFTLKLSKCFLFIDVVDWKWFLSSEGGSQCGQIGLFLKCLGTKLSCAKVAQILGNFLGWF